MPILRRNTNPTVTTQPADTSAVPSQRDTQESTRSAEAVGYGRHEAAEAPGPRPEARRANYGLVGTLMILSGMLTFFIGITGIIRGIFFNTVAAYPFYFSVRGRGVTLLVIGVAAFVVGVALLVRLHWARYVADLVVVVSALANFMFLPFYPFWSVIVLALDVLILWELSRAREKREFARTP